MYPPSTPYAVSGLSNEELQRLRAEMDKAENIGQLTKEQLAIIYKKNWFKLFVPHKYQGLELGLIEGLKLEESLAWIDGSLGWTVTLCSGATMFVGYMPPSLAKSLFETKEVCFGGSGRATGKAAFISGNYYVNGKWAYATGAPHNTAFTANCLIERNGKISCDHLGKPVVKSFLFLKDEVELYNDWNTMGLKATAGYSFAVKEQRIHENRAFLIDNKFPLLDQPVYRYPFLQFAETTLAINTLGMARRFFELCNELFREKEVAGSLHHDAKIYLFEATAEMERARAMCYELIETSWSDLITKDNIENELLNKISVCCKTVVKNLRRDIAQLFPYCGMAATHPTTELNRVWRNIFTASQHSLLL